MNERIKELAEQAGIHFHNGGTLDAGSNGIAKFVLYSDMEKFAELIIKECAKHAVDFNNYIQSLPDKVMRSNLNRVGDYLSDRTGDVE